MNHGVKVAVCDSIHFNAALRLLAQGGLTSPAKEDVMAATSGVDTLGAIVTHAAPGRVGWLWPPAIDSSLSRKASGDIERQLIRAGLRRLAEAKVRLAQALAPQPRTPVWESLEAAGFQWITEMISLERDCQTDLECPDVYSDLTFVEFDAESQRDFLRVVQATYEGTLDCPELDNLRSVDEVLEGYRAGPEFDPGLWVLARHRDEFVGCVLLATSPSELRVEIQYMGVVAPARRRGIGRCLVIWAHAAARDLGATVLCLNVDSRNSPALILYKKLGFVERSRRGVFLHKFDALTGMVSPRY